MYDPTLPLNFVQTLHAAALAADGAQQLKFNPTIVPLPSTLGDMPHARYLGYQPRLCPSGIAYARGAHMVVAFAGIQGPGDALQVYNGWMSPTTVPGFEGKVNAFAKTWFDTAYVLLDAINTPQTSDYLFVGHSWGAAIATIGAIWLKRHRPTLRIRLVTLGAPRFADAAFLNQLNGIDFMRLHCSADPFPYLVPWFSEAPLFHSLHSPLEIRAMNSYTHMGNGMFIKRGEQPRMMERGTEAYLPLELNISSARSLLASGVEPHWTTNYERILFFLRYDQNPRLHNAEGQPQNERALPTPNVTPQAAEAIAAWPNMPWPANNVAKGHPPAPEPVIIPELLPKPVQSPGPRIRIRQYAGIWGVFVDGHLQYKATSKRDARGVAKAMRTMGLQMWQNPTGFTDPEGLLYAAAGFLS